MNKEEFSIDLSEETAEKIKDILGIKEVEEIHKRFENGTETIEDLLKNYISYHIKFEFRNKEIDTEMIELKYYKKLINLIQKQEKIIDKMAEKIEKCKNEIDGLSEGNIDCFIPNEYSNIDDCIKKPTCKECIKEYFKKVVDEDVKD